MVIFIFFGILIILGLEWAYYTGLCNKRKDLFCAAFWRKWIGQLIYHCFLGPKGVKGEAASLLLLKGVKRNNGKDGKIELDELKNCSWINGVNNEMHELKYAKQKR